MAKIIEKYTKRIRNIIFFYHHSQTKDSYNTHKRTYNYVNLTWKKKAYYQIFKIIEDPTCTCGGESRKAHRLLYDCKLYNKKRTQLKDIVTKNGGRWPINKHELVAKYFIKFIKCIS